MCGSGTSDAMQLEWAPTNNPAGRSMEEGKGGPCMYLKCLQGSVLSHFWKTVTSGGGVG